GELTRRAFLNGKLDLVQAEAVLALTSAERDGDVRAAARALAGGIGAAVERSKQLALRAAARIEAALDVYDDDEEAPVAPAEIAPDLEGVARDAGALLERAARAPARALPVVAIAGRANAGKSTLLNALAGRELALVSPVAGTTRDAVEAEVAL